MPYQISVTRAARRVTEDKSEIGTLLIRWENGVEKWEVFIADDDGLACDHGALITEDPAEGCFNVTSVN